MRKAMRVLLASGTAAVVGFTASMVQAAEDVDVTVGADLNTAYVWRGQTLNDDEVIQPSVDLAHESGLGLNVWANFDLGDNNGTIKDEEFSEVDITLSYALPVEDLDVTVGAIYYILPQTAGNAETTELFVSLGHAVDMVNLGLDVYYDVDEFDDFYGNLSASVNVPITEEFSVDVGASIGAATEGGSGFTDDGLADWNVSLSSGTPLTETVELGVFIAYTDSADSKVLVDQATDVYGGISVYGSL